MEKKLVYAPIVKHYLCRQCSKSITLHGTLYPTTQRLEDALVPSDGILLY